MGQLIPFQEKVNTFRDLLAKMEKQLALALPKHIKADRLIRIVLTEIQRTPQLMDCTQKSLLGAIMQAAQLGLEPGGVLGQAYLMPFKNHKKGITECQLVPGYKGLIKLAYQSGEVGAIRARIVREADVFEYEYGLMEKLIHKPSRKPDAGPMVAVYGVAKIKVVDEPQFYVLERWEVEEIRDRFAKNPGGPWSTDFEDMAKKSAIRRLVKLLPASTEKDNLAHAVVLDEYAEAGLGQQFDGLVDVSIDGVSDDQPLAQSDVTASAGPSIPSMPPGTGTKLDKLTESKSSKKNQVREPGSDDE